MSTKNKFYKLLTASLLVSVLSNAQVASTLEMVNGTSAVGYNFGPTVANHVVTLQKDASNNSNFQPFAPAIGGPITATFSLLTQNYTGFSYGPVGNNISTGLVFGAGPSLSTGGPTQQPTPFNSYDIMNSFYGDGVGPNNGMFTSNLTSAGNGIDGDGSAFGNDVNSGVEVFTVAQRQYDLGTPYGTSDRYDYGTIRITFSRFVKDPVVHLAGLGGSYRYLPAGQLDLPANYQSTFFATELELLGGGTLSLLSGNPYMTVSGKNILNNAAIPNGGSQPNAGNFNNYGAATGSVKVTGTFVTLTFRVWLRGCTSSQFGWSSAGVGVVTNGTRPPLTGDVWMMSTSVQEQLLINLPTTGVTLAAALNNNNVSLNWKTLTEANSKSFDIERSTDGINFVKIGEKDAAGYSSSDINYSHIDPNMMANIYYYRLKIIDIDNSFKYSNTAIVRKATKTSISVFPNPVTDYTNVEFANAKGTYSISVINQAGQVLQMRNVEVTGTTQYVRIDKGNMPAGMYHLRIVNTQSGEAQTQKLIVK